MAKPKTAKTTSKENWTCPVCGNEWAYFVKECRECAVIPPKKPKKVSFGKAVYEKMRKKGISYGRKKRRNKLEVSMKTKQKRDTCHLCGKPITQAKAHGYDVEKGYYHSSCKYKEKL